MFCGGIHSFQSFPEVERCCNAFLNAVSRVCSHDPTHGYSMAYGHVLHHAKKLKYEWAVAEEHEWAGDSLLSLDPENGKCKSRD